MSFKTILEEAEKRAGDAVKTSPKRISVSLELPEGPGVYLIYKDKKVLYVGQSDELSKRFRQHLSDNIEPKGSTFRRKLMREYHLAARETRKWIMEHCEVSIINIDEVYMRKLVEALLIVHFRGKGEATLNS